MHHLTDPVKKAAVVKAVEGLDVLRQTFVGHMKSGKLKHCGCGQADCPVFFCERETAQDLDRTRERLLSEFRSVLPTFHVELRPED